MFLIFKMLGFELKFETMTDNNLKLSEGNIFFL